MIWEQIARELHRTPLKINRPSRLPVCPSVISYFPERRKHTSPQETEQLDSKHRILLICRLFVACSFRCRVQILNKHFGSKDEDVRRNNESYSQSFFWFALKTGGCNSSPPPKNILSHIHLYNEFDHLLSTNNPATRPRFYLLAGFLSFIEKIVYLAQVEAGSVLVGRSVTGSQL